MSTTSARVESNLASVLETLLKLGFALGGIFSLAVGVWMLAAPANWYDVFPAGIPDTGPMNAHFIRDLGGWYMAGGVLLLFALTSPRRYGGVALIVTLVSYGAHAATHISDLITNRLPASHWLIDTLLVFMPVIAWVVLLWVWWTLQGERHPELSRRAEPLEEEPDLPESSSAM
jgi:hypothetical protein